MQLQLHSNIFLLQLLFVLNRANVLLYFMNTNFTFCKGFYKAIYKVFRKQTKILKTIYKIYRHAE